MLWRATSCIDSRWIARTDDPSGEATGSVGPGLAWSHVVVRPFGCTAKFSEMTLEVAYSSEMYIQLKGNSTGGHSLC